MHGSVSAFDATEPTLGWVPMVNLCHVCLTTIKKKLGRGQMKRTKCSK